MERRGVQGHLTSSFQASVWFAGNWMVDPGQVLGPSQSVSLWLFFFGFHQFLVGQRVFSPLETRDLFDGLNYCILCPAANLFDVSSPMLEFWCWWFPKVRTGSCIIVQFVTREQMQNTETPKSSWTRENQFIWTLVQQQQHWWRLVRFPPKQNHYPRPPFVHLSLLRIFALVCYLSRQEMMRSGVLPSASR